MVGKLYGTVKGESRLVLRLTGTVCCLWRELLLAYIVPGSSIMGRISLSKNIPSKTRPCAMQICCVKVLSTLWLCVRVLPSVDNNAC